MKIEPFKVVVIRKTKRVTTRNGIQTHRGYIARVRLVGMRESVDCGDFHQKARAARAHGEKIGRYLVKESKGE